MLKYFENILFCSSFDRPRFHRTNSAIFFLVISSEWRKPSINLIGKLFLFFFLFLHFFPNRFVCNVPIRCKLMMLMLYSIQRKEEMVFKQEKIIISNNFHVFVMIRIFFNLLEWFINDSRIYHSFTISKHSHQSLILLLRSST